jgi:glycosyltransferase involved in cell wall biosynthesis
VTRVLRTLLKPLGLFLVLLLHLPLAALGLVQGLRRPRRVDRPDPVFLVSPFAPGNESGGAKAVQDLVSVLETRPGFRIVDVAALKALPSQINRAASALLAWPLPFPPQCRALILGHGAMGRALGGGQTVLFEFFATALYLYLRPQPAPYIVLRDHEVLVRKLAMEYREARGLEALSQALRLGTCYLVSLGVYRKADRIVTLTEEDRVWLVWCFPFLAARTTAIPVPFFVPSEPPSLPPLDGPVRDLLMVANFFHRPNVDGVVWFLRECAPHLEPGFTLHICGIDRPLDHIDWSQTPLTVKRHGFVDDIAAVVPPAAIAIAPVISGSGVRMKNLLLASLGRVIVTTPLGNEGIGFVDGEHAIITADGRDMARRVNDVSRAPERMSRLGRNANAFVSQHFSPAAVRQRFDRDVFSA